MQRNRVAAAGLAHGCGIQGAGTHLANDPLAAHVEADWPADGAGVGDGDYVAIGLLEEKETNLRRVAVSIIDVDALAVQLFIGNLTGGNGDLLADEGYGARRAERGGALGVDELCGGQEDKEEAG